MALSINALVRLQALDECFRDKTRNYCFKDLVEACCEAMDKKIPGREPGDSTVSDRQIRSDIAYMRDPNNWGIDLITRVFPDKAKAYCYKYRNQDFSIKSEPLIEDEKQLKKSLSNILDYFKDKPDSSWLTTIGLRIADELIEGEYKVIIPDYNHWEDLKGFKEYFVLLYNAIYGKQVIKVDYLPFNGKRKTWILSPYFLKEYNNRWFLFAYNHEEEKLTNIALDRIENLESSNEKYINSSNLEVFRDTSYEQYFDDIIGVSFPKDGKLIDVVLKFSEARYPHVKTKHIHPYQRENDAKRTLTIKLVPNRELIQTILSFGKDVEVIKPQSLRDEIKDIIREMSKNYGSEK